MSNQPAAPDISTHIISTHNIATRPVATTRISTNISTNHDVVSLVDDTKGRIFADPARDWPQKSQSATLRHGWAWLAALLVLLALALPDSAQAAPLLQSNPGTSPQLYLLPRDLANNPVVVDSHIATLRVADDAAGPLLTVNAIYHLRNPASSEIVLPLQLYPGGDQSLGGYQALALNQNQQPLLLQPGDSGGFLSQITLAAGGATTLNLQYQVPLGNDSLATVRYAPAILNGWSGNISLRVELELPSSIPAESWVEIMPADWRYSVTTAPGIIGLRWLYDFTIPEEPIRLRFITPRLWAELTAAQGAATSNAAAPAFVRLGDLYRDLASIAPSDNARQRFYAQAIAAYSGGLASAGVALATPTERASLHIGLADLYRRRLVEVGENERGGYADLMVTEIDQALALLPAEDGRAIELRSWQLDGMQLQLNQARDQRNWPAALAIVEQMALLPAEIIDPAQIAEDRRFILIQQALELMEQGNRVAALAVAGDQISTDALVPPAQAASLFSGWQISLTVTPETIQMIATGLTQPDRHAEALAGLEEVVKMWENGAADDPYTFNLEEIPAELNLQSGLRLQIDFPPGGNGFLLARLLPPRADYALLRGLLTQLAPTTERQTGLIWQQIEMRQPMNLTQVVNEWNVLASGLEEQAAAFDAESNSLDADGTASAEAALTARLQAVNYRTTAAEWRRLARQSALNFRFQVNDPLFTRFKGEPPSRAWTVTAAAPSQTFVFQTQVLSLARLLVGIALAFVLLISVAGVLWGLL